jgi:hypothetical protein
VRSFATVYVTGWDGQGSDTNPCQQTPGSNGGPPLGHPDDQALAGEVVGHLIKFVSAKNDGGAGTTLCDPTGFGDCVPVLTK